MVSMNKQHNNLAKKKIGEIVQFFDIITRIWPKTQNQSVP